MSSSWLLLHRVRHIFHAVNKPERRFFITTLTSQQPSSLRIRNRSEIPSAPRLHRIVPSARLTLSTATPPSSIAAMESNCGDDQSDDDLAAVVATAALTAIDTKESNGRLTTPSAPSSQRVTKRSLSSSVAVEQIELVVEEVSRDSKPTPTTATEMKPKRKTNKKITDSVVTSKPVKNKPTKVQPKASTPSTYRGSKQATSIAATANSTVVETNSEQSFVQAAQLPTSFNDSTTTDIQPSYFNVSGIMTSSYATSYLENSSTVLPDNATIPNFNYHTHTDHFDSDSSSSPQPEYIVISRTPIPTTKPNDGTSMGSITEGANIPSTSTATDEEFLNPYDLIPPNATTGEWKIPYPKALSPSSIKEFQSCPQSFLFQYLLGLRQPASTILAKGTMCHSALERIFDIEPQDRSLPVLQNLFRTAWAEQRTSDTYRILFEEDVIVDELQEQQQLLPEERTDDETDSNSSSIVDENTSSGIPLTQPMLERRRNIQKEITWGKEGLALLQNYWIAEDASSILRPNPVQREVWVKSNLPLVLNADDSVTKSDLMSTRTITSNETTPNIDPVGNDDDAVARPMISMFMDTTSTMNSTIPSVVGTDDGTVEEGVTTTTLPVDFDNSNITKFLVRGIVDRLDMVQDPNNKSQISLRLIDYKSGKAPDLKYSPSMNLKIQNEAFDQLLIYALLLRESNKNKINPMPLRYLRLFYLTSIHDQKATYWDMDLGETQEERDAILHTVHVSLSNIYRNICKLIDKQDFTLFQGCQRSFCYCHKCRPRFTPGTVWQPPL